MKNGKPVEFCDCDSDMRANRTLFYINGELWCSCGKPAMQAFSIVTASLPTVAP